MPLNVLLLILGALFIVVGLPVLCGTALKLVKGFHDKDETEAQRLDEEESQILMDLHKGLEKMDKRIEALETIIINKK